MTNDFESLIKRLADSTYSQVESEVGTSKWSTAFLDARFNKQERSWLGKIRATNDDGADVSISLNSDISLALVYLKAFRGEGANEWYGILLNVWPDRRCVVKLNYDSNCATDKSFCDA